MFRILISVGRRSERDTSARVSGPHAFANRRIEKRNDQLATVECKSGQLVRAVMFHDVRFEKRSGFVATGHGLELEASHDVVHVTRRETLSLGEHHHGVCKTCDFRHRVAYIDDRDIQLVAQALDVVEDLGLARHVERRQRLVHEKDARLREQGAADRDALLFSSRQGSGFRVRNADRPRSSITFSGR